MTTFDEIMSLPEMEHAKVIAGKKGADKPVSWLHIVYDVNIGSWIGEYNLIFTNGSGLKNPEQDMLSICQQLKQVHASGIMIERGKYINVISPKVLRYADEAGLPIIEVTEKPDIAKLTYKIGQICFKNENAFQRNEELKKILLLPYSDKTGEKLRELGYEEKEPYLPVAFSLDTDGEGDNISRMGVSFAKRLSAVLKRELNLGENEQIFFEQNGLYYGIFRFDNGQNGKKNFMENLNRVRVQVAQYEGNRTISIGVGNEITDIKSIRTALFQAKYAIESLRLCHRKNEVRLYEDMGVYRIFFQYQNDAELIRMYDDIIGNINFHNSDGNGQLLETLEAYYDCDSNIGKTAETLFIHRNTLKYRLQKIEEILKVDIDDPNSSFSLQFALKIKKYLLAKNLVP